MKVFLCVNIHIDVHEKVRISSNKTINFKHVIKRSRAKYNKSGRLCKNLTIELEAHLEALEKEKTSENAFFQVYFSWFSYLNGAEKENSPVPARSSSLRRV